MNNKHVNHWEWFFMMLHHKGGTPPISELRIIEDGEERITEDGEPRVTEGV